MKEKDLQYIDDEEKEIMEIWKDVDFSKLENDEEGIIELRKAVKNIKKQEKQAITLRMPVDDLQKIKVLAKKRGLPYQTFIKSILHQLVENSK